MRVQSSARASTRVQESRSAAPRTLAMNGVRSQNRAATLSSKFIAPTSLSSLSRPAKRAVSRQFMKQIVAVSGEPMNIVFVSAEVSPWSKTGGLGDVVGSLPIELAKRGHKVMSVAPRYDQYKGAWDTEVTSTVAGEEGIVNGMDPTEWNPSKDKYLDLPYDEDTVIEGKAAAKAALQAEVGLPVDPTAPLFGYIGRLEEQKGVDIMLEAIKEIAEDAQVIVLGTGKKKYETAIKALEEVSPNAVGVAKFSSPLAHMINAEGLTGFQVGAMDPDDLLEEDVAALVETCKRACEVFSTPKYAAMVKECISQDLSWKEPAKKWEGVLETMLMPSEESSNKKESVATPKEAVISKA
eukprot:gene16379-19440_t